MTAHMIWLVGMAIATIIIITVGTLAAAGMLSRQDREAGPDHLPTRKR